MPKERRLNFDDCNAQTLMDIVEAAIRELKKKKIEPNKKEFISSLNQPFNGAMSLDGKTVVDWGV